MKCDRCGKETKGFALHDYCFALHDYCAECSKNLCAACMKDGCCGNIPAKSGNLEDHGDDREHTPDNR